MGGGSAGPLKAAPRQSRVQAAPRSTVVAVEVLDLFDHTNVCSCRTSALSSLRRAALARADSSSCLQRRLTQARPGALALTATKKPTSRAD